MSTDAKSPLTSDQILEFLARHEHKQLLRFVTIGSVDDGKSTLIGRLLYESGGVFDDQLAAVTTQKSDGSEEINFANITDGLVAEREQGITIDVAYRYTTTPKRKFIIADTPGHVQYTRNMATGASTAHAAIILIDARLGVLQQSRRHAYIANLLGIPHLLVAVNKMDLIDYDEKRFREIEAELAEFTAGLDFESVGFFPVSALAGDNVVQRSKLTDWYDGCPILEHLETLPIPSAATDADFFMPVQLVIRPDLDFRGYAGTIASGALRPGDSIKVLPSGKTTRIKSLVGWEGELDEAFAPMAVNLTLEDEIDISRGDVLCSVTNDLHVSRKIDAVMVWMNEVPLEVGRQYLFKHTTSMVAGSVTRVHHRVDMDALEKQPAEQLALNDIGTVTISLNRPLILEEYTGNHTAGAFIVIDRISNATVGAGMIRGHGEDYQDDNRAVRSALTAQQRGARFNQKPTVLWMTGRSGVGKIVVARALEQRLFDAGHMPFVLDPAQIAQVERQAQAEELDPVIDYCEICAEAGLVAIVAYTSPARVDRVRARERLADRFDFVEVFFDAELATCRARLQSLGRNPNEADRAYEPPEDPDLVVDGDELDIDKEVDRLVRMLEERGGIFS